MGIGNTPQKERGKTKKNRPPEVRGKRFRDASCVAFVRDDDGDDDGDDDDGDGGDGDGAVGLLT